MKLYLCQDGTYVGTQADAKLRGKHFEQIEVPTDKEGLLAYLNQFVNAVEDLRPDEPVKDVNEDIHPERAPSRPSYTAQSLDLDDQWESLPLARKLHFAALAVEDARALTPTVAVVDDEDPFA